MAGGEEVVLREAWWRYGQVGRWVGRQAWQGYKGRGVAGMYGKANEQGNRLLGMRSSEVQEWEVGMCVDKGKKG